MLRTIKSIIFVMLQLIPTTRVLSFSHCTPPLHAARLYSMKQPLAATPVCDVCQEHMLFPRQNPVAPANLLRGDAAFQEGWSAQSGEAGSGGKRGCAPGLSANAEGDCWSGNMQFMCVEDDVAGRWPPTAPRSSFRLPDLSSLSRCVVPLMVAFRCLRSPRSSAAMTSLR